MCRRLGSSVESQSACHAVAARESEISREQCIAAPLTWIPPSPRRLRTTIVKPRLSRRELHSVCVRLVCMRSVLLV